MLNASIWRDDLKIDLEKEIAERKGLEVAAAQKSRDILAKEDKGGVVMSALKKELEDKSTTIAGLEDEIKMLKKRLKKTPAGKAEANAKEEISQYEIRLLATEEDLEQTKTILRQEENKTQKQMLQIQMMKDRLFKLEEREEKYKTMEEEHRLAFRQRNEAQTDAQHVRRQMADVKTILEDEVKERQQTQKLLEQTMVRLEEYENQDKSAVSVHVQTDEEPLSRPTSRISDRFGAISPAVHVFDGPVKGWNFAKNDFCQKFLLYLKCLVKNEFQGKLISSTIFPFFNEILSNFGAAKSVSRCWHFLNPGSASHRIVPGGFRGCNYAAGMPQESLVRPSTIKQGRIKIPANKESFNMTFVQDVSSKPSESASSSSTSTAAAQAEKKCVLKITKETNQNQYRAFVNTFFYD